MECARLSEELPPPSRKRSSSLSGNAVLGLQASVGNRVVTRMLQLQPGTTSDADGPGLDEVPGGDLDTKKWQRFLNSNEPGKPEPLRVDGVAGPKSETAARLWQWRNGLPIVGLRKHGSTTVVETHGGGL